MDDFDFINALRESAPVTEAEAQMELLKTAAPAASTAVGALIGGAVLATGAYLGHRPGTHGKSREQMSAEAKLTASEKHEGSPDFGPGLSRASAKYNKDLTDVFAKHPGKAALIATPIGAAMGAFLAKKLFKK